MAIPNLVHMETISEFYEKDHNRLDELFKNYQQWKKEDYPRARESFVSFKFGLQRHIIWEEEILFPFFEKKTGIAEHGPTEVMRREHRMIGEALEAIHKKVQVSDPDTDDLEQQLLNVLELHNHKEENVLYPAMDVYAKDPIELKKIFDQMWSIPKERYATCCNH